MGVTRSASVALSALVAGCIGYAAQAEVAEPPARTEASERTDAPVVQKASVDPATPSPVTPDAAKPASVAPEAPKPPADEAVAPTPDAAPAPVAETPAPPPVPSDPLSAAVAARLAESAPLLARLTTKEREAIQAFYALGAFKPVWIVDGAYTPAAKAAGARLAAAGEDGLKAAAYPVPVLGTQPLTEAQVADAELKLSAAVVLYARDARGGRIHLPSLSRLITPTLDLPAADAVLGRIATAGAQAGALLQAYNPSQPGYLALKARLAAARNGHGAPEPTVQLPAGPVLKLGMRDPRVPALRARFALASRAPGTFDDAPGEADAYDAAVAAAVASFQRRRGLPATGTLTQQTVAALGRPDAAPASDDEAALIVNMERWRWLPADLGRDYVMVNIPEFQVRVFKDGRKRDEARVIVGKVESPTPIFSGLMEYAVVNPSWNVPPSILKNEFLPGLARDPNYAARRGYEVVYRNGTVSVRQPPGERNALGFIKFMFPNNHAVYLHDTPNRSLFSGSRRALSHGCVRVDDPFRFADAVLPEAWTGERLKKLIGKGERTVRLAEKLPVHLAYFTAFVDDAGAFRTLPDLYGYDARMKIALGLAPGSLLVAKAPAPKATAGKPAPKLATPEAAPKPRVTTTAPEPRRKPVREVRAGEPRPARTAARPPEEFGEPGLWGPVAPRPSAGWW